MRDSLKIWLNDIPNENYWSLLSDKEQSRAAKFHTEILQQHYIGAHGQLRLLLAEILKTQASSIRFSIGDYGKPYLTDYPDWDFNLSHSAGKMAVVIGQGGQVGIDIEHCQLRNNLTGLAKRCFANTEFNYWQQLPKSQQPNDFYRFWTLKEAFVKASGRGIALGLEQCVFDLNPKPQLISSPLGNDWQIEELTTQSNFKAALVYRATNT